MAIGRTNAIVGGGGGLDTSDATATASSILLNSTAYAKGEKITGTIPSMGAATITPGITNQTIAAGQYLSGAQTILGDSDLVSANIKSGANIFGVAGNSNVVDTTSGTATAAHILSGTSAYVKGAAVSGGIGSKGAATYTPTTYNQSIAAGQYLSGAQTIAGDGNLAAGNIRSGVSIFGVGGSALRVASGTFTNPALSITVKNVEVSNTITVATNLSFTPTVLVICSPTTDTTFGRYAYLYCTTTAVGKIGQATMSYGYIAGISALKQTIYNSTGTVVARLYYGLASAPTAASFIFYQSLVSGYYSSSYVTAIQPCSWTWYAIG